MPRRGKVRHESVRFLPRFGDRHEPDDLSAAQDVTDRADGGRTAPSAGALYPLEVHVVSVRVDGLPAGAWRYRPATHDLVAVRRGDLAASLVASCRGQAWMKAAPAHLVITGVVSRTAARGAWAQRYVHVEAGCAAQNVALQAAAVEIGTVVVGAFDDEALARILGLPHGEQPLRAQGGPRMRQAPAQELPATA